MASKTNKYTDNVPGQFYVDQQCIACIACCTTAPDFFKMNDDDGHAYLAVQPSNPEQVDQCKEAMAGCPVEAIGNDGE
jgi:ferredoxin